MALFSNFDKVEWMNRTAWYWAFCVLFLTKAWATGAIFAGRPSPQTNSTSVGARAILMWHAGVSQTENLLANPSFEQGTNGWIISPRGRVVKYTRPPEGTNVLQMDDGFISQEVSLPATSSTILWSFAATSRYPMYEPQALSPSGQLLKRLDVSMQGRNAESVSQICTVDISESAGQPVNLRLSVGTIDFGVYSYFDDFRVSALPENVAFDVYFGRRFATGMDWLGRTTRATWPLSNLQRGVDYQWRIDTIFAGATNHGPTWRFRTGGDSLQSSAQLGFESLLQNICASDPLPVTVSFQDRFGFNVNEQKQTLTLTAAAEDARAPTDPALLHTHRWRRRQRRIPSLRRPPQPILHGPAPALRALATNQFAPEPFKRVAVIPFRKSSARTSAAS